MLSVCVCVCVTLYHLISQNTRFQEMEKDVKVRRTQRFLSKNMLLEEIVVLMF